jgi:hypothetical protein
MQLELIDIAEKLQNKHNSVGESGTRILLKSDMAMISIYASSGDCKWIHYI